jgi:hypothetical protein
MLELDGRVFHANRGRVPGWRGAVSRFCDQQIIEISKLRTRQIVGKMKMEMKKVFVFFAADR